MHMQVGMHVSMHASMPIAQVSRTLLRILERFHDASRAYAARAAGAELVVARVSVLPDESKEEKHDPETSAHPVRCSPDAGQTHEGCGSAFLRHLAATEPTV